MRMNHPDGKRLLAQVRGGNYAHAGEEDAIRLLWDYLPQAANQSCLDAGCGRGGTAAYIQRRSWAKVTGMDIDAESVAEAATAHPEIIFHAGDITTADASFPGTFDVICAFNAFYAFPDQHAALQSLARACKPAGTLALFDYVDRGGFSSSAFGAMAESRRWKPLVPDSLRDMLADAGWRMTDHIRLDQEYLEWYQRLLIRFEDQEELLRSQFDSALVAYAMIYYRSLLQAIDEGVLGGAIVCATRCPKFLESSE